MAEFKVVITDPKRNKAFNRVVSGHHANSLIGKKIGDETDGIFVGLPGYKLIITGGSDKDGFPMRDDMPGPRRKKLLLSKGIGFHPSSNGVRKKKTMRGNTISPDIVQINMKVKSYGPRAIEDILKAEGEKK